MLIEQFKFNGIDGVSRSYVYHESNQKKSKCTREKNPILAPYKFVLKFRVRTFFARVLWSCAHHFHSIICFHIERAYCHRAMVVDCTYTKYVFTYNIQPLIHVDTFNRMNADNCFRMLCLLNGTELWTKPIPLYQLQPFFQVSSLLFVLFSFMVLRIVMI